MKEIWDRIYNELTQRTAYSILDIVFVSVILYALFAFLKKNNAQGLIKYVIAFAIIGLVLSSSTVGLSLTGRILTYTLIVIALGIATMFPQELRRNLWRLSSPKDKAEVYSTQYDVSDEELHRAVDNIVRATQNMAKNDVGALIVIAPTTIPPHIIESGTELDSKLSCPLLECLFNTKAPLHDGAVFIRGNRIIAAGCFLPLSQDTTVDKALGTRHRAAIGITESCNVVAIIVSEETGIISVAADGELTRYYDSAMLAEKLEQVYGLRAIPDKRRKRSKV